jgi:hypothetical protein
LTFLSVEYAMPVGLRRYYGQGHLHFITFSCYRRLPLLKAARVRDIFVKELGKVRDEMGFHLVGYVVMPEHVLRQSDLGGVRNERPAQVGGSPACRQ